MPTTNSKSNASSPVPANVQTPAAKRAKARKPPVADRVTVSASPPSPAPATAPPPTAAPAPAPAPAATPAPTPAVLPVSAPPQVAIPGVPDGFVPVAGADLQGYHPLASQIASVPDSITEMQAFTGYTSLFGITAPDLGQLSQRLGVAIQWTTLLSQSSAWFTYVKSQEGLAWKDALLLLDQLKAPFQLASQANPALLSQYPAIARLLGARQVVGKRAAAARAKKKANAQTATAAAPTPAAAASDAPATAAAPAPTRVVTVQG
ncbi:MAG TPA: hypothetical protein VGL81_18025 [Polyangiaceae bacterium]|jgi:hypothetical protein